MSDMLWLVAASLYNVPSCDNDKLKHIGHLATALQGDVLGKVMHEQSIFWSDRLW
jgi:hypothetical protein